MARVAFDDLVEIYRRTRFDGNGGGVLTVAIAEIANTLRVIEADEQLYDDAQLSLIVPADPVIGSEVAITVGTPKLSLGVLAADFDALFRAPGAVFAEPTAYYVIDPGYARGADPVPEPLLRYRALLSVVARLRDAASYVDEVQRELVYIGTDKVIVPVQFGSADLPASLHEQSARLNRIFDDALHADEKSGLLSSAVVDLVAGQRLAQRFPFLVANLDRVCDEVEKGYRLFASSFSYSKIRNEVETARLDYINKIHKTIVDVQGQLLGIPIATIVVASQLKPSSDCGVAFWTNTAVLLGAWIFVALLSLAITNQWHTLSALASDVRGQRTRLTKDYAAVSDQFDEVFEGLQRRIRWHRKVLGAVLALGLLGVALATMAYLTLNQRGSGVCLLVWR